MNRNKLIELIPESIRNKYGNTEEEIAYNFAIEHGYSYKEKIDDCMSVKRLTLGVLNKSNSGYYTPMDITAPYITILHNNDRYHVVPYDNWGFVLVKKVNGKINIYSSSRKVDNIITKSIEGVTTFEKLFIDDYTLNESYLEKIYDSIFPIVYSCLDNYNIDVKLQYIDILMFKQFIYQTIVRGIYVNYKFEYKGIKLRE